MTDQQDDLEIRPTRPSEVPYLAELNQQLQEDQRTPDLMSIPDLTQRLNDWLDDDYRAVLFEIKGEPIAYALFRPAEDGVYMRQFFVIREFRRRGLGRAAISLFREQFVAPDQVLSLEAYTHNDRAIAFYRAIGFEESTRLFRMRGAGESLS